VCSGLVEEAGLSRWDIAKSADRSAAPDLTRIRALDPRVRLDAVDRLAPPKPSDAVAPRPRALTPESVTPSVRLASADLGPLARSTDALIADLSRIEITLSRLGARQPQDAHSIEIGSSAVREVVRRMKLVVTAGDALVAGGL
jgi:hypothetical protein